MLHMGVLHYFIHLLKVLIHGSKFQDGTWQGLLCRSPYFTIALWRLLHL